MLKRVYGLVHYPQSPSAYYYYSSPPGLPAPPHGPTASLNGQIESRARRRNLQDGRPKHHHRIRDGGDVAARHERVRLPAHRHRHHGLDHAADHARGHRHGDQAVDKGHVEGARRQRARGEGEGQAGAGRLALRGRQGGEGGEGQRRVAGGAGGDEGGGQRVGGVGDDGAAVGVGGRDLAEREALQRRVDGLEVQDGARDGQVRLVADGRRGAQVRRRPDALEDRGQRHEGLGVREGERVFAGGDGCHAGGGEGRGQQHDVRLFVVRDVFQVVVVGGAEAGFEEHRLGHGADAALVEDILEVLELWARAVSEVQWRGRGRHALSGRTGGCQRR